MSPKPTRRGRVRPTVLPDLPYRKGFGNQSQRSLCWAGFKRMRRIHTDLQNAGFVAKTLSNGRRGETANKPPVTERESKATLHSSSQPLLETRGTGSPRFPEPLGLSGLSLAPHIWSVPACQPTSGHNLFPFQCSRNLQASPLKVNRTNC